MVTIPVIQPEHLPVLGGVSWLCQHSPLHLEYPVGLLLSRILPAIANETYRYLSDSNKKPLAFCCWTPVSKEVEASLKKTPRELLPDEWSSGDRIYFLDFIAPFGHAMLLHHDLKSRVFPEGLNGFSFRIKRDSSGNPTYRHVNWNAHPRSRKHESR